MRKASIGVFSINLDLSEEIESNEQKTRPDQPDQARKRQEQTVDNLILMPESSIGVDGR